MPLGSKSERGFSSAIEFHDRRASDWSRGYRKSPHFARRARDWTAAFDRYLIAGAELLDIGCGSGDLAAIAAQHGAHVTGVDGSSAMIDQARRKLAPEIPRERLIVADANALPLPPATFDVVIASSLLEYLDPLPPVLEEIRRVVRTGGMFLCTVPNPRSLYRRLEGIALGLTGRPTYRRHVNPEIYRLDVPAALHAAGFAMIEARLTGLPPGVPPGRLAGFAERHPLLATMTLFVTRAVQATGPISANFGIVTSNAPPCSSTIR